MSIVSRMIIATLTLVLCLTSTILGQIDLSWHTIDGGGEMSSTGGSFSLDGTIGQPDAGVMTGGSFELSGGFWPGRAIVCACPGDMNSDGMKDGLDVQKFVDCFIAGGSCSCADIDAANGLTLDDVLEFVSSLLDGIGCS